jgi:superfamily I DNA/RNA helicase
LDWTRINPSSEFAKLFHLELNVFYVGGTRARKSIYFTNSIKGLNSSGEPRSNNRSCFLSLNGLMSETLKTV